MSESLVSVNLELGVADTIKAVDEVMARRQQRGDQQRTSVADDIIEDALTASLLVKKLDDMFIELVAGFAKKKVAENPRTLGMYVASARKYLQDRDLLPKLEEVIGRVRATAYDNKLSERRYRELVISLRTHLARLEAYREALGRGAFTSVGQRDEWNLMTLCERAEGVNYGGGKIELPIDRIAEEVLRNHDFDLSDSVHRLGGEVQTRARLAAL